MFRRNFLGGPSIFGTIFMYPEEAVAADQSLPHVPLRVRTERRRILKKKREAVKFLKRTITGGDWFGEPQGAITPDFGTSPKVVTESPPAVPEDALFRMAACQYTSQPSWCEQLRANRLQVPDDSGLSLPLLNAPAIDERALIEEAADQEWRLQHRIDTNPPQLMRHRRPPRRPKLLRHGGWGQ